MRKWVKGIDVSYGRLTVDTCQRLWDDGVRVVWQCLWTGAEQPSVRVENLRMAHEFGFIICGYISVAGHHDGGWHVQHGRAGVPGDLWDALRLVVVDVELVGIPNSIIHEAVELLFAYGKRRAIYTSFHAWVELQGDPWDFTNCLLCNALWDDDEDFDFPSLSYGNWKPEQVVCEQYAGGADVFGVNADRDMWDEDLLKGDERMIYTDEKLTAVFTALLDSIAKALDIGTTTANALIVHVANHPGGGATQTMAEQLKPLVEKVGALEADYARFKAAIAAVAT